MRAWLAAIAVLASVPLTSANAPIVRSGSYAMGDPLAYDFGVDECERQVLARVFSLNWPSTGVDGGCFTVPQGYAGHDFTLDMGGAQVPSEGHVCFYSQASAFLGCSMSHIPSAAAIMGPSSPDGVLVSWRMDIDGG